MEGNSNFLHLRTLGKISLLFWSHGIILEKTPGIIKSQGQPTKPCPRVDPRFPATQDFHSFLGSLFHGFPTLLVKKYSRKSNLNFPWCNFRPFPLIPSLVPWGFLEYLYPYGQQDQLQSHAEPFPVRLDNTRRPGRPGEGDTFPKKIHGKEPTLFSSLESKEKQGNAAVRTILGSVAPPNSTWK